MDTNELPPDDLRKLNEWKKKFKDEWDYRRKLIIFEGSDGVLITPTTTTSTAPPVVTTLPVTPGQNTSFSAVVTVNTTDSVTPNTGGLATADTRQLLTVVGITCVSLVAIILVALVIIRVCRKTTKKRDQNISIRRPLNSPEPEEHIYAEIEPLQLQRSDSRGGASGRTVSLPSKKQKKRLRGVSSFRALSMRIQRLFNVEQSPDTQSVFYNRSEERPVVQSEPPEAPRRNIVNGSPAKSKHGKGKGVKRFESQSRRPLLDGDSQMSTTSGSADTSIRDNIYNPLLRNNEARESGPYDHLHLNKTRSGHDIESEVIEPASPHDYFRLEATSSQENPLLTSERTIVQISEDDTSEVSKPQDYFVLENETAKSANTEDNASETPVKHDYFILEPQPHTECTHLGLPVQTKTDVSVNPLPESTDKHKSDELDEVKELQIESESPSKTKPTAKPRNTVSPSSENKPIVSNPNSPSREQTARDISPNYAASDRQGNTYVDAPGTSPMPSRRQLKETDKPSAINGKKIEDYELYKLGDAPVPPSPGPDDYLEPLAVKKEEYIDVYPTPPPRTTSVQPDSPARQRTSANQQGSPTRQHGSPVKQLASPGHNEPSPTIRSGSPIRRSGSPEKHVGSLEHNMRSPTKHSGSSTRQSASPVKQLESTGHSKQSPTGSPSLPSPAREQRLPGKSHDSPVRQRSPVKEQGSPGRRGSPVKTHGSPMRQTSPTKKHGSPVKQQGQSNLPTETTI